MPDKNPDQKKKTSRLKRALRFLLLSFVLFPLQGKINLPMPFGSGVQNGSGAKTTAITDDGDESDEEEVLGAQSGREPEYDLATQINGRFFINDSGGTIEGGLDVDGTRNYYVSPRETSNSLHELFRSEDERQFFLEVLQIFRPEFSSEETGRYIDEFQILAGQDVDKYLEEIRKGSWGTTILKVGADGKIKFDSISLRQFLLLPDYQDNDRQSLKRLAREEFFQAHQYQAVVAELYNQGYLEEVAEIDSPQKVTANVAVGNLRAFLELFPQQKFLMETGLGSNSYNFYVGEKLYAGDPNSRDSIDRPYFAMVNFIKNDLGIEIDERGFLDADKIKEINEKFRSKYGSYYRERGFDDEQIQIWNLVGMKRLNRTNPDNSIDMRAKLLLPLL